VKLPRDLSGKELVALLQRLEYRVVRQTGSHIRLTCTIGGHEHHLTVPAHRDLKLGIISAVVSDVATQHGVDREQMAERLFGK
jgi:predicted RNA binding protein YcfA (HicA-like mRNA interferase family)